MQNDDDTHAVDSIKAVIYSSVIILVMWLLSTFVIK